MHELALILSNIARLALCSTIGILGEEDEIKKECSVFSERKEMQEMHMEISCQSQLA